MNKKNSIIICGVIIILGVAIALLMKQNNPVVILGNNTSVNNTSENLDDNQTESDDLVITALSEVKSYTNFFTINNIMSQYYEYVVTNNGDALLDVFNDDFKNDHNINKQNINNYYTMGYSNQALYIKEMYVKGINDTMFYFINGQLQTYDVSEEFVAPENDIKFLVTIDEKNQTFNVTPLDIDGSIYLYASTYKIVEKAIKPNEYNKFEYSDITKERITKYYTAYYKELLYLDTESAYNMLSDTMKEVYPDLETFVNNLSTIYSKFTTELIGYEVTGEDGKRKYYSYNAKEARITMQESSIMNFTVTIEE